MRDGRLMQGQRVLEDLLRSLSRLQKFFDPSGSMSSLKTSEGNTSTSTSNSTEERVTDPVTGGQKGSKLERFDLVPSEAMEEVARVYGTGARKYADRNWEKGYKWGLSIAALERHLNKFKQGHERDELGNHHLAAVVFHALALMTFQKFGLGTDDRSKLNER